MINFTPLFRVLVVATVLVCDCLEVDTSEKVKLIQGEEFIVSCTADSEYDYCKFTSPAGDKCHFYRSSADRILEEFCQDLNNRTSLVFSGSVKEFECALLVRGARPSDAGRWSCEVGTKIRSRWALAGEINIEVQQLGSTDTDTDTDTAGEESDTITSVIQANTTLLVICVVVFVLFMMILMGVVIMFGRSRLSQKPPDSSLSSRQQREAILRKEEQRLPRDFIRRVLPHIIKFPIKDNQPSHTL